MTTDQTLGEDRTAPSERAPVTATAVTMLLTAAVGLTSAIVLLVEKVNFLTAEAEGGDTTLGCDVNAFVSCGGVINTDQASVFGFPNPIIGVAGFAAVATLAVVLLSGTRLPTWMWSGLQAGALFGVGFVTWLQYQSIYVIQKLCPWCMVVWAIMIPLFVVVTARHLKERDPHSRVGRFLSDWTVLIVLLWYVAIASAIWFQFGSDLWA
ncbi:vitamin K epoxide reductase family protein [Aeromicrobium sp. CF4.19]|uniref:vitamin K epoxide reductase family protein n=1 Tax=Aeromicrobium sp. CF4.19 TaxID=3373082 RepID=UPI003EE7CD99